MDANICRSELITYNAPLSRCLLPKFHEGLRYDIKTELMWDKNGHVHCIGDHDEEEL